MDAFTEDETKASPEEVKAVIRHVHELWYKPNLWEVKAYMYELHQHLGWLFNHAGIEDTLCVKNPDKVSPSQWISTP